MVTFLLPTVTSAALLAGARATVTASVSASAGLQSMSFAASPLAGTTWVELPDSVPIPAPSPVGGGSAIAPPASAWTTTWDTSALSPGTYNLRVTATDRLGHSSQAIQAVTVGAGAPRGPPGGAFTLTATPAAAGIHLEWMASGSLFQVERSAFDALRMIVAHAHEDEAGHGAGLLEFGEIGEEDLGAIDVGVIEVEAVVFPVGVLGQDRVSDSPLGAYAGIEGD